MGRHRAATIKGIPLKKRRAKKYRLNGKVVKRGTKGAK